MTTSPDEVMTKIGELFHGLLRHEGFGELRVEVRLLKRGQKEVIVHCGKQYRYVVDSRSGPSEESRPAAG